MNVNLNSVTPPLPVSISPINTLLQQTGNQSQVAAQLAAHQQQQQQQHQQASNILAGLENSQLLSSNPAAAAAAAALLAQQLTNVNSLQASLGDNSIKDKLQALFDQTKKEEERRRKLEEEYQLKVIFFPQSVHYSFSNLKKIPY